MRDDPGATAMSLWEWIAVGLVAWVAVSILIGVTWSLIARSLKRHRDC